MRRQSLGPADWCDAALDAIAAGGIEGVVVESLAKRLGVSKGSFYWHFENREALLRAAAERWEQVLTDEVIDSLAHVGDPVERLRVLLMGALGRARAVRVEAGLVWSRDNDVIAPVLRRVTRRRVSYLTGLFVECGHARSEAEQRARVAYGAYVGLFLIGHANPAAVPPRKGGLAPFIDSLVALLTR
jgi:AcrR family transcriptional regulator